MLGVESICDESINLCIRQFYNIKGENLFLFEGVKDTEEHVQEKDHSNPTLLHKQLWRVLTIVLAMCQVASQDQSRQALTT